MIECALGGVCWHLLSESQGVAKPPFAPRIVLHIQFHDPKCPQCWTEMLYVKAMRVGTGEDSQTPVSYLGWGPVSTSTILEHNSWKMVSVEE